MYANRRNGRQLIIIGVTVVILVLAAGIFLLNRGGSSGGSVANTATTTVVVASQSIPQGTTFQAGQDLSRFFSVQPYPKSSVPFGAYTSVAQIQDFLKSSGCQPTTSGGCRGQATTTETIYSGLPVVGGMFSTLGQFRIAAGPAFRIPYGYVAVGISFGDIDSVLGSIQPGDDIDIIGSYQGPENTKSNTVNAPKQTQYLMNDVRVIGVGGPPPAPAAPSSGSGAPTAASSAPSGGTLLLLVRYQQALVLQHLKDFSGSWKLSAVLRSARETDVPHFRTLPVTEHWFFFKNSNHFDTSFPY